jgi:hypothetical protein
MNAFRLARNFKPAAQARKFSGDAAHAAKEVATWTKMTWGE